MLLTHNESILIHVKQIGKELLEAIATFTVAISSFAAILFLLATITGN